MELTLIINFIKPNIFRNILSVCYQYKIFEIFYVLFFIWSFETCCRFYTFSTFRPGVVTLQVVNKLMWLMGRALASGAYREASQPPGDGGDGGGAASGCSSCRFWLPSRIWYHILHKCWTLLFSSSCIFQCLHYPCWDVHGISCIRIGIGSYAIHW